MYYWFWEGLNAKILSADPQKKWQLMVSGKWQNVVWQKFWFTNTGLGVEKQQIKQNQFKIYFTVLELVKTKLNQFSCLQTPCKNLDGTRKDSLM